MGERVSEAQAFALSLAAQGDLIRHDGGFWALRDEPLEVRSDGQPVPERYVASGTIYALDRKRMLQEVGPGATHPWSGPRRITALGRKALADHPPHSTKRG